MGSDVRKQFSGDPGVVVGGAAVTVDELTKTTQDDLKRIAVTITTRRTPMPVHTVRPVSAPNGRSPTKNAKR